MPLVIAAAMVSHSFHISVVVYISLDVDVAIGLHSQDPRRCFHPPTAETWTSDLFCTSKVLIGDLRLPESFRASKFRSRLPESFYPSKFQIASSGTIILPLQTSDATLALSNREFRKLVGPASAGCRASVTAPFFTPSWHFLRTRESVRFPCPARMQDPQKLPCSGILTKHHLKDIHTSIYTSCSFIITPTHHFLLHTLSPSSLSPDIASIYILTHATVPTQSKPHPLRTSRPRAMTLAMSRVTIRPRAFIGVPSLRQIWSPMTIPLPISPLRRIPQDSCLTCVH